LPELLMASEVRDPFGGARIASLHPMRKRFRILSLGHS
jgi:hypothetical protein